MSFIVTVLVVVTILLLFFMERKGVKVQASGQGRGWDPVPRRRADPLEERVSLPLKLRKGEDTVEFAHLVAESFLLTASILSLRKPGSIHMTEERPRRKLAKDCRLVLFFHIQLTSAENSEPRTDWARSGPRCPREEACGTPGPAEWLTSDAGPPVSAQPLVSF